MRILPQRKELRIPILMYHSISESNERRMHLYYETCTSAGVFAEHMKFLYENKYKVIKLDQAVKILKSSDTNFPVYRSNYGTQKTQATQQTLVPNALNKQKFVVLTFDDGFRDFYKEAFPVLQNYRFPATMFLPTAYIDNKRLRFKGKECLSWEEVRELRSKGVIFGSHTVNHPILNTLKKAQIEFELKHSKKQIEDEIGETIECFSYPFAFPEEDKEFIKSLRSMLKQWGYKYGVSTRVGTNGKNVDILFLKRIPVNSFDDPRFFQSKLEGAYNWLYKFQDLFKFIKRQLRQRSHANDS